MSGEIRFRTEGPLARITIDRPPLNILCTAMLVELGQSLERADSDDGTRLIRLDAEGKLFSAGVDVADHVGDRIEPMLEALTRLFDVLESLSRPTISVVHGPALGGGCELALATDLCFASERASFGQPEIRLGQLAPPASVLLPRLVGERRALELLLSGEAIPASEAERIGIVNRVFPEDRLEREVAARLERLSELSGAALRHAKRAVRAARGLPAAEARRAVQQLYSEALAGTADATEGPRAFLEKRPPRWKHA